MAKPLEERQRAALSKSARLADVVATIEDTRAARDAAAEKAQSLLARAVDPLVAGDDALDARLSAARAEHDRDRHDAALTALEAKRGDLVNAEAVAARAAKYEAVRAERDQLADDLRTKGADALAVLADLIKRGEAQQPVLAAVNAGIPAGREFLVDAECLARGFSRIGVWPNGNTPVLRLSDMRVPHFERRGLAWPDEDGIMAQQVASANASAAAQADLRRQRDEREAGRRWYTVQRTDRKMGQITFRHANGIFGLGLQEWHCELYADQVQAAEAAGMIVKPAEPPADADAA